MEQERTATETWDERATALFCICIATSLMLVPQCSTFAYSSSRIFYLEHKFVGTVCTREVKSNVFGLLGQVLCPLYGVEGVHY